MNKSNYIKGLSLISCLIFISNNNCYAKPGLMPLAPAYPILSAPAKSSLPAPVVKPKADPLKDIVIDAPETPKRVEKDEETSSNVKKLNIDDILKKAVDNSFELKMSGVDVGISKTDVTAARSEYLPTFKTDFYSEYGHDMTGGTASFTSVGTTVLNTTTAYQDMLNLSLSYKLYDFGVRGRKLSIAKKDVKSKQYVYNQTLRDIKIKVLDLYTDALVTYKDLIAKQQEYPIYKELYSVKQQLYNAGTSSKLDIADAAIKMAQTNDAVSTLQARLKITLKDLSFYTQEKYDTDNIKLADYPEQSESYISNTNFEKESGEVYRLGVVKKQAVLNINAIDFEKTPDYKSYQLEIEKKKAEVELLKRQQLPSIGIYSMYTFYGSDKNSLMDSYKDFADRNLVFGVSASMVPFDGLKTQAGIRKAKLEMEKLKLDRDRKIADLRNKYEKANEEALYYDGQIDSKEELLSKVQDKLSMYERLTAQNLIDKATLLNQKADLIEQKVELEKTVINRIGAVKKLNLYAEIE